VGGSNGQGNGNGGGAPVVAGPTPPAPGNPSSGNGNANGGGNGTPSVSDPTPPVVSGGSGSGNGAGTPAAAGPTPPASQPPQAGSPESPKAKPVVESAPATEQGAAVQSPAEWDRPVGQFRTEAVEDRFAEFMGKAIQGVSDRARDIFKDIDSRRDQLNEFRERSEARKYFPYSDVMPGKRLGQNFDRNEMMDQSGPSNARPDVKPDAAKGLMNKVA
jgi:hypothetical protein